VVVFGVLFYSYTYHWFLPERPETRRWRILVNGAVFGALSVVLMIARMQVSGGAFIDARNVPVALIGLFEGWPAGLLAALAPAAYRLWLGGSGAAAGVAAVLAAGLAGGLAHAWARRRSHPSLRLALVLSLAVFLTTTAAFLVVGPYGRQLFGRVWLALLLTHVIGIAFTARLMGDVVEQAKLRGERERFRAIIDEATDAIRIVDADTLTIVEVNRRDCELARYDRQDLVGRDVRQLWPGEPALRSQWEAVMARAAADGFVRAFDVPYRTRTGEVVLVDVTQRIVEHGGHRYAIGIFREAVDRVAAEAARREAVELRAVNLLASAAAHEINNPLAVIMGALDLVARRVPVDSEEGNWLAQAQRGVRRVRDIVARMARITHLEAAPPGAQLPAILDITKSSDPKEPS
jgi:PAS domain S-box-containing protein